MQADSVYRPRANVPAIVVGVALLIAATLGILYNCITMIGAFRSVFEQMLEKDEIPYFYPAFFMMSGICILLYIVLLVCGVDLARSKLRLARLVILVLVLEVVYFFLVGMLWLDPTVGRSVAAASGVANGGMMVQFGVLLPLWAPLLLWWAKSRQQSPNIE